MPANCQITGLRDRVLQRNAKKRKKKKDKKKSREFFLTRAERSGTYIDKAKSCKGPPAVDNSKGGGGKSGDRHARQR